MQYQLLPNLTVEEYQALKADIAARGVQVPVEYDDCGNILDGHHRVLACQELGITEWPRIVRVGMTEEQKTEHILALNLDRRHLTRDQREELVAKLREQGWSTRRIADKLNVSHETVRQDVQNAGVKNLTPITGADGKQYPATRPEPPPKPLSLFNPKPQEIERARYLARLSTPIHEAPLIDGHAVTKIYREAREQEMRHAIDNAPVALPVGKYRTIVIDPPWDVQKIIRDERPNQDALDYPTMSDEEIEALPIDELADPAGCHVYLWVTHKKLPIGLELFAAWYVNYQCLLTWIKPTGMTPYSWMYNTEHVLFGRIGSLQLERMGLKLSFESPITRHSEKPPVFYDLVCQASPAPRLEMFARTKREGYTTWGNEVA